jgi:hypothetical protein
MADNSELDKMRLAAMMNKSPATGGLKATNTVTPSFGMGTPIEQAYSRWKQDNSIAAKLLRGEQMSGEDIAKNLNYQLEAAMKDPTSFLGTIKAVGNLNLVPRIAKETLKGPETQTLQSFMNQVKQMPGVTKEGLKTSAGSAQYIKPDTKMTKAEFEAYIAPSKYQKVDLKTASGDITAHYRDMVEDNLYDSDVVEAMRIPERLKRDVHDILQENMTFEELSPAAKKQLKNHGIHNMNDLDDAFRDQKEEMIQDGINYNLEMDGYDLDTFSNDRAAYKHQGQQRLLPMQLDESISKPTGNKYFEIGVTHPEQRAEYRHYNDADTPKGLIGHVRGSHVTEPTPIVTGSKNWFNAEPGSSVIEEIQSDAQKIADQTGHLHQVHGTLAKAAIQDALEKGSHTVYVPTSRAIGAGERHSPGGEYASIYDDAIIREALGPLQQVPGVKITPPKETPYSYPWSKYQDQDAFNVLGIPKKQHNVADLFLEKDRPWFQEDKFKISTPREMVEKRIAQFQDQLNADTQYLNSKRRADNTYMIDSTTLQKYQNEIDNSTKDLAAHQNFLQWLDTKYPGDTTLQQSQFNDAIKQVYNKRQAEIEAIKNSADEMPYHKIEFSPEAIEHILKGPGQTAPGYKQGGTIHQDKMNYAVHMAGGGQPNNKFSYASGLADLAGLDEEYYNANTIPLQHFDKSTEHNGPADAMRHMLFQAQITKNHSPTLAKIISQGHERLLDWGQPDAEQAMDFHNDALGREIGAKAKTIDEMTQMAKDAITSGRAKVIGHGLPGKYYKLGGNVKNVSTNTGKHGNIALTTAQIRANLLRKKHG